MLVANLYYAQPLTGVISHALGMPAHSAGLIVTLPLTGYAIGLLMIVPLGDLFENRKLVLTLIAVEAICTCAASLFVHPATFLTAAFLMGLSAAAVQVLVPYSSFLVPEAMRGRVVGRVVSGIMLGIMLARPLSSFVADAFSWRAIFGISSALMALLFLTLRVALPPRRPTGVSYAALLRSMGSLFVTNEILRRRAIYHACMFGAFTTFWTAVPLWLTGPQFGLTQKGVAWVALAGVAGAVAPPIAGRIADKGMSQRGTALAMLLAAAAMLLTHFATDGSPLALAIVTASAVLLDFAVSANLVFGQRAIFALRADERSRLNGLYTSTFFVGGAVGAAASVWSYSHFGWPGALLLGLALPLLGLLYFLTERQSR